MPFLLLIWNNKRWTLIVILIFYGLWQTWQSNHLASEINKLKTKCEETTRAEINKALKPYLDAEKKAQEKANEVSEKYEDVKQVERVKTETITREVQKIVDRPIYINVCFDDDGVSAVNKAAGIEHTAKP